MMSDIQKVYVLENGNKISVMYDPNGNCTVSQECMEVLIGLYHKGRADERKSFEDINLGLSKEDARRIEKNAIEKFSGKLFEMLGECNTQLELGLPLYTMEKLENIIQGITEQLKEQKNE